MFWLINLHASAPPGDLDVRLKSVKNILIPKSVKMPHVCVFEGISVKNSVLKMYGSTAGHLTIPSMYYHTSTTSDFHGFRSVRHWLPECGDMQAKSADIELFYVDQRLESCV